MTKALELAEKACALNHPWACVNAARMLATGKFWAWRFSFLWL